MLGKLSHGLGVGFGGNDLEAPGTQQTARGLEDKSIIVNHDNEFKRW